MEQAKWQDVLLSQVGADLRDFRETDYEEDGLMHCGVCGEPLQRFVSLPFPGYEKRVIRRPCKCERKQYEREEQEQKYRADQVEINKLRAASLIDEKFRSSTFDSFQITTDNAKQLKICKRYAIAFDTMCEKNQGMILWGKPGTGKTFAAACIANYLLDRKIPVIMTSFVKLISSFQNQGGESEEETIYKLNRAALLIIDDLGAERSTDYALERVYNIVDSRYRARKPMLLTTNLTIKSMMETEDLRYARIYDRVFEVCYPLEFVGHSWRFAEAAKRFDDMGKLLENVTE